MKLYDLLMEDFTKEQISAALRREMLIFIGIKEKMVKSTIEHFKEDSQRILTLFLRDDLVGVLEKHKKSVKGNKKDLVARIRVQLLGECVENYHPLDGDWDSIWSLLDTRIVNIAQTRVESGHYADAVFYSLVAVEERVKIEYRKHTGRELVGKDLMMKSFGSNSEEPIIRIDDASTLTGMNRQEGYRHLFAGAMEAIRNPKGHGFEDIDERRTIHFLFIASLLMTILDEARVA